VGLTELHGATVNPQYDPTRDYTSLNNRGIEFQGSGHFPEAMHHFALAIIAEPDRWPAYNNFGTLLEGIDQVEMALPYYRRAGHLSPDCAVVHNNLGVALLQSGTIAEAYESIERAVALDPKRGRFYRTLAATGRVTLSSPHFATMRELAGDIAALPEDERIDLHFALGLVYLEGGEVKESWPHLLAGNRLKRQRVDYDEAAVLARIERIEGTFTAEFLAARQGGLPSSVPIFVLGMPRSGTSLVEQILASHPRIAGAGELIDLRRLADDLRIGGTEFPESTRVTAPDRLSRLAADYLAALRARAPHVERVVDKMPGNFELIGLIHKALPHAHIIHVRRDPLDTCMSCFSRLFATGLPFTYDLTELGRYYRAYDSLMAHWRRVLPAGAMLEIRYEELVADLPTQAKRMIAHCGMAWDDRCAAFHETRRVVKTASAMQVRQPVYRSSIGRWRSLGQALRPLTEELDAVYDSADLFSERQ